ncbi:hypothetical protein HW35_01505 [Bacillus sp. X1(2014)]|nr:hypothetical protein HW35_01505 [Bacillus sp. X1(2014)]
MLTILEIHEAQIEAYLLAKPELLPEFIRPKSNDVLCRQVPISPFKPENMDRADICIFKQDRIMEGLIPNVIIELKKGKANRDVIFQVTRYLKWLKILLENTPEEFKKIKIYVLAPSFNKNIKNYIEEKFEEQIILMNYFGEKY